MYLRTLRPWVARAAYALSRRLRGPARIDDSRLERLREYVADKFFELHGDLDEEIRKAQRALHVEYTSSERDQLTDRLERLEDFRAQTLLVELQFNARLARSDFPGSLRTLSRLKQLAVAHEAQAAQHQRAYDASTNAQSEFHRKQLQLAQFLRTSLDDLLAILDTVPVSAGSARLDH